MKTACNHQTSIIVEWENAVLADLGRPKKMLASLLQQVQRKNSIDGSTFDLIFAFNPEHVQIDFIKTVVFGQIKALDWPGTILFISAARCGYYEQKNIAALHTKSDHLLFLDSDVIPAPGWLDAILTQIRKPEVKIVGGNSYIEQTSLVGRLFALFWFFPIPEDKPELYSKGFFFANNVAFNKEIFLQASYPNELSYRGQCVSLCKQLKTQGEVIWGAGLANVNHPAPNGLLHFIKRALARGHDKVYWNKKKRFGFILSSPPSTLMSCFFNTIAIPKLAIQRGRSMNFSPLMISAGILTGITYELLSLAGSWISWLTPFALRNRFDL